MDSKYSWIDCGSASIGDPNKTPAEKTIVVNVDLAKYIRVFPLDSRITTVVPFYDYYFSTSSEAEYEANEQEDCANDDTDESCHSCNRNTCKPCTHNYKSL